MPTNDTFQRASFAGIPFPFKAMRLQGRIRYHEHVYLKTPGAVIEKMSRGLYAAHYDACFDSNIRGYTDLYPGTINRLRSLYEQQVTAPLVISGVGTMPAFLTEWDQSINAGVRSGQSVPLNFLEDATAQALELAQQSAAASSVQNKADALVKLAAPIVAAAPADVTRIDSGDRDVDLFAKIQNAANSVFSVFDQAQLGSALVAAKIYALSDLCREADRTVKALQDPVNYQIVDALHELMVAANDLSIDVTGKNRQPRIYTTRSTMTVAQISNAIYGSTERAMEIMQNNDLANPMSVPAGESLIYFPEAA